MVVVCFRIDQKRTICDKTLRFTDSASTEPDMADHKEMDIGQTVSFFKVTSLCYFGQLWIVFTVSKMLLLKIWKVTGLVSFLHKYCNNLHK